MAPAPCHSDTDDDNERAASREKSVDPGSRSELGCKTGNHSCVWRRRDEREKGEDWDAHLGNTFHEQDADKIAVIGTVICNLLGVYNMPSTAPGNFHY